MHVPFAKLCSFSESGVNLCPENEDDQPVPKTLIRLMKRAELLKINQQKRKSKPARSGATLHPSYIAPLSIAGYTYTVFGSLQTPLILQYMAACLQSPLQLEPQKVLRELERVPCL